MRDNIEIKEAFDIFEKQYDLLLRKAVSILGNLHDAEDVMQDLAITIIEKEDFFDNVANCRAYLFTSLRNLAIDLYRKKQTAYDVTSAEVTERDLATIEKEFEAIENKELIEKLLSEYAPEIREAFIKHVLDGYSINELAKEMGMTANNLSQKIKRMKMSIAKQNLLFTVFFIIIYKNIYNN